MNFIIPKNYKFKNKIFGIIDYPTAIVNIIWNVILYFIIKNFTINISTKIFIFTTISFPVLLLTIIGFNDESPLSTLKFIVKFIYRQKIYVFRKFL